MDASGLHADKTAAKRRGILALLVVSHVAIAAICTPAGVPSGQWANSLPGIRDPDFLMWVASGAILVHSLILYPLWAALGPGDYLRRFAMTAVLCMTIAGAEVTRAWWRGFPGWPVFRIASSLVQFSLVTFGFRLIQRLNGWQISVRDEAEAPSIARAFRPRLSLRLLLELVTLAACVAALCRFHFPHGLPPELTTIWWRGMARAGHFAPFAVLIIAVLLPTAIIPCITLAFRGHGKLVVLAAGMCWAVVDCSLIWLMHLLGLDRYFVSAGEWVLAVQLGASGAVLISALVVRCFGYRILSRDIDQRRE